MTLGSALYGINIEYNSKFAIRLHSKAIKVLRRYLHSCCYSLFADNVQISNFPLIHWYFPELDTVEATAKFDYLARTPQELSFKKGDTILLHCKASGDWWKGELSGMRGLVPHKYINIPEG